jgi:hypothetical protein
MRLAGSKLASQPFAFVDELHTEPPSTVARETTTQTDEEEK